jgi:hypothetical protein
MRNPSKQKKEPKQMTVTKDTGDAQLARDREQLANVDAAISESIDALRVGRSAVSRGVYQRLAASGDAESGHPGDLINAGRRQVINQLGNSGQTLESGAPTDLLSKLTQRLSDCLFDLTSEVPKDRVGRLALEARLHAALTAYIGAVRKVLHPLHFERTSSNNQL